MLVQLLTSTPDPEQVVAAAARLCYSDASIAELLGQAPEQADRLLDKIMELGHFSVLEHASFTFGIEGISRSCSHQLVRHRIASFSQQSQRYVSHGQGDAAPGQTGCAPALYQGRAGMPACSLPGGLHDLRGNQGRPRRICQILTCVAEL